MDGTISLMIGKVSAERALKNIDDELGNPDSRKRYSLIEVVFFMDE